MNQCPECCAELRHGETCEDHFHLMGAWELDHQLYDVHHLMVRCYHLQHPSLYSLEGLAGAKKLFVEFLEQGVSPQEMRQRISKEVDSGVRAYKIKGTPELHGQYAKPIRWTMWASDVTHAGIENFYASVEKWSELILKSLREWGNLD